MYKRIKIILLISISILLILPSVTAIVTYYPPAASWQQGYWDSTSGSSASKTDVQMYFNIEGGGLDGDEIYYVSNLPIDLRNISYLRIKWEATFSTVPGACVFGIDGTQLTKLFTTNTTKTTTFGTTYTYLDVSSYYGDYYIKIGGYALSGGISDNIKLWVYDISAYNFSYSFPLDATSVEMTTATLNGYLVNDSNISCTRGFWVSNTTGPNASSHQFNFSAIGTGTIGSFSASAIGLISGEYYYVRSWSYNGYTYNRSGNETYFLTRPYSPANFSVTAREARSIYLQWTNTTLPPGQVNHSVLIHYGTSVPVGSPTPDTWGTFGANTSLFNTTLVDNLAEDTTFYFVAWTYINNSGSPSIGMFSSEFVTTDGTTHGGIYNITVSYENESYGAINLSKYGIHMLIIHYENQTDYIYFDNGTVVNDVNGYFGSISSGNFTLFLNNTPRFFEFKWNSTNTSVNRSIYYCSRLLVPESGVANITFYIITDLAVYGESTFYFNDSIVKYSYSFIDETGQFTPVQNALAYIYTFDNYGNRLIIHSEYFDSERKVHPWLVYDKKYYIGVSCDSTDRERLGISPTGTDLAPSNIRIPYELIYNYGFFDVINLNIGWYASGFYASYVDTTSSTSDVTFVVYGLLNGTQLYTTTVYINTYNFTYTTLLGCNLEKSYRIDVIANLTADNYAGTYRLEGGGVAVPANMKMIVDNGTLDAWLTLIFGNSPVATKDRAFYVPWTYLLMFSFCFLLITTLGKLNVFVGGLSVGISLIFFSVAISNVGVLYSDYSGSWEGPILIVVGAFIAIVSFIGLLGGIER